MKYVVTLNGKNYEVEVTETDAIVTGVTQVPVMVAAAPAVAAAPVAAPAEAPKAEEAPAAPSAPAAPTTSGTQVKAPMPGSILAVKASAGQAVKAGDVIVVLEAMKMENDIVAPCDGTVKSINAPKGSTVNTDDVLAVL